MLTKNNSVIRNIWLLIRPYRKEIIISFGCTFFAVICGSISPILNRNLIDNGLIAFDYKRLICYSIGIFLLVLVSQALNYVQFQEYTQINNKVKYKLNYTAMKHTMKLKILHANESNYLQILKQIEFDINAITKITDNYIIECIGSILKIISALIGLSIINWKLALVILIFIPIKTKASSHFYKMRSKYVEVWMKDEDEYNFWLGDSFGGIFEIKLWSLCRRKLIEFKVYQKKIIKSHYNFNNALHLNRFVDISLESLISDVLIILLGANMILNGTLTIGGLFSFITYSRLIIVPISYLLNIRVELADIKPSLDRYLDYITSEVEGTVKNTKIEKNVSLNSIETIEFQNVSLEINDKKILDNISFKLNQGEKIALVGTNGSGKSSIINTLLRFYEPTQGRILINGNDVFSIPLDLYRERYSVMSQKSYLFNDTIHNNIVMYKSYDRLEISDICEKIGAESIIRKMVDDPNFKVGNDGSKLSGGEKQKISLTRTLVKNGAVLILDEATSNFDYESEKLMNTLIRETPNYDMSIVISHRPEVLKEMDKIVLIENGKVIDIGNYEYLQKSTEQFQNFIKA